jgi:uncharacterized protein YcnI
MSLHKVKKGTTMSVLSPKLDSVTILPLWSVRGRSRTDAGTGRCATVPLSALGGPGTDVEQADTMTVVKVRRTRTARFWRPDLDHAACERRTTAAQLITPSVHRASRPSWHGLLSRVSGALGLGIIGVLLASAPAWAHVTVHPTSLPAGSSDVELTFRVPNERDDANTVELQVFFPTNLPLITVDVLPVPGWNAVVQTRNLSKPVQIDDGEVSQVVSEVTWTASNGGIGQGQYEDFPVAVGAVPDHTGHLVFKALQTYSSGEVVRWIEVPSSSVPLPDSPAPMLTLSRPSTPGAVTSTSGGSSAMILGVVAVVLSTLNLGGLALLLRRGRPHLL